MSKEIISSTIVHYTVHSATNFNRMYFFTFVYNNVMSICNTDSIFNMKDASSNIENDYMCEL